MTSGWEKVNLLITMDEPGEEAGKSRFYTVAGAVDRRSRFVAITNIPNCFPWTKNSQNLYL
jgi:hypothetical protein